MAVDLWAFGFSYEWNYTDMAAGETVDGRTPCICPIHATDKSRNLEKDLEKPESVLYRCGRGGRRNRLFTVAMQLE